MEQKINPAENPEKNHEQSGSEDPNVKSDNYKSEQTSESAEGKQINAGLINGYGFYPANSANKLDSQSVDDRKSLDERKQIEKEYSLYDELRLIMQETRARREKSAKLRALREQYLTNGSQNTSTNRPKKNILAEKLLAAINDTPLENSISAESPEPQSQHEQLLFVINQSSDFQIELQSYVSNQSKYLAIRSVDFSPKILKLLKYLSAASSNITFLTSRMKEKYQAIAFLEDLKIKLNDGMWELGIRKFEDYPDDLLILKIKNFISELFTKYPVANRAQDQFLNLYKAQVKAQLKLLELIESNKRRIEAISESKWPEYRQENTIQFDQNFEKIRFNEDFKPVLDKYQTALFFNYLQKNHIIKSFYANKDFGMVIQGLTGHSGEEIRKVIGRDQDLKTDLKANKSSHLKSKDGQNLPKVIETLTQILDQAKADYERFRSEIIKNNQ